MIASDLRSTSIFGIATTIPQLAHSRRRGLLGGSVHRHQGFANHVLEWQSLRQTRLRADLPSDVFERILFEMPVEAAEIWAHVSFPKRVAELLFKYGVVCSLVFCCFFVLLLRFSHRSFFSPSVLVYTIQR